MVFVNTSYNLACHFKVDAVEYYSNLEETLTRQVMDEKRIALQSNLGMAFVSVQNEAMGTQ